MDADKKLRFPEEFHCHRTSKSDPRRMSGIVKLKKLDLIFGNFSICTSCSKKIDSKSSVKKMLKIVLEK